MRISGTDVRIKELIHEYFENGSVDISNEDIHDVAGIFKRFFLFCLKGSIFTLELYEDFLDVERNNDIEDEENYLQELQTVINKLPKWNRETIHEVVKFFSILKDHEEKTKMGIKNLSIVIGPTLIWKENLPLDRYLDDNQLSCNLVTNMIIYHDRIEW
eukprot:TRINITY_DN2015_c0_g5_i2.p1 TRINITY_DN2015_c0_g5~~TRINITY_DN2015_c0_g5_i2.p1  ORF type:complete len:159 (-),score=42.10 TRINITY_DN2015_c0_g5_i2:35-511(-)